MKRALSILIVMIMCISAFVGCTQNYGDKAQFDFSYSVEKTKYSRGETIQITATVTNVSGKAYRYVGCSGNDFIPLISLYNEIDGEKHYIECNPIVFPADVVNKKVKNGESGSITYSFIIPEDAKLGNYSLTLSSAGDKKEFTDVLSIVELTAQNETEKYGYSSTIVSSGNNNIQPIKCFRGTTQYENGEPTLNGCGDGVYRVFSDPETKISDFPVLVCDGDITVSVPVNVTLGRIEVYDTSFQELEYTINDFSDLTALPYGEYLIVFSEQIDGRGCDAEIVDYWITDNESLFRLVIQEPTSKDDPDSIASPSGQQVAAPDDFAIHFETWIDDSQRNILDTYEGYIQKDLITDGISKKDYNPSYVELCQLYQFVLALEHRTELDFSKTVTYDNYADEEISVSMDPLTCYYLKFTANGKTIEISGDATANECTDQSEEALFFMDAIRGIGDFYRNTEVYKTMPKANDGYE